MTPNRDEMQRKKRQNPQERMYISMHVDVHTYKHKTYADTDLHTNIITVLLSIDTVYFCLHSPTL